MSTSFRKYGKRVGVLLVVIALVSAVFAASDRLFKIEEVRVSGAPVEVEIDQKKLPHSLLFFPVDRIENELLADNPIISSISITKQYPHVLDIKLTVREPLVRLIVDSQQFLVDGDGVVLSENLSQYPVLPIITMPLGVMKVGGSIRDGGFLSAISFVKETKNIVDVEKIEIFDSTSLRAKVGKTDIVFPQKASMKEIASTLQTIFSGFRIKGTLPTRIDLRFEKPIVTF